MFQNRVMQVLKKKKRRMRRRERRMGGEIQGRGEAALELMISSSVLGKKPGQAHLSLSPLLGVTLTSCVYTSCRILNGTTMSFTVQKTSLSDAVL